MALNTVGQAMCTKTTVKVIFIPLSIKISFFHIPSNFFNSDIPPIKPARCRHEMISKEKTIFEGGGMPDPIVREDASTKEECSDICNDDESCEAWTWVSRVDLTVG